MISLRRKYRFGGLVFADVTGAYCDCNICQTYMNRMTNFNIMNIYKNNGLSIDDRVVRVKLIRDAISLAFKLQDSPKRLADISSQTCSENDEIVKFQSSNSYLKERRTEVEISLKSLQNWKLQRISDTVRNAMRLSFPLLLLSHISMYFDFCSESERIMVKEIDYKFSQKGDILRVYMNDKLKAVINFTQMKDVCNVQENE